MAQNVLPVVASHPHPLRPSPCAASHQRRTSPVPWAHPLLHKSCAQKIPKVLFLRLTSMAKKIQQFLAASLFRSVSSIFKRSERWRSASKCSDLPQAVLDVTPTCVLVEKLFESHPQWKVFQYSAVQGTMLVNQFWIAEHFRQVRRRYSCIYTIANHLGGNNYLRKTFTANRDGMEHTRNEKKRARTAFLRSWAWNCQRGNIDLCCHPCADLAMLDELSDLTLTSTDLNTALTARS